MAIARRLRDFYSTVPRLNKQYSYSMQVDFSRTPQLADPPENPCKRMSKSSSAFHNTLTSIKNNTKIQISGLDRGLLSPLFQIYRPRFFSAESNGSDYNKEVDEINIKFSEAREEIEMAMESKETVYFDEEAESARTAVKETLEMFNNLLGRLPEAQKGVVQRSMGLKMEQLKEEVEQLNE